jgi:hypothetical protein
MKNQKTTNESDAQGGDQNAEHSITCRWSIDAVLGSDVLVYRQDGGVEVTK